MSSMHAVGLPFVGIWLAAVYRVLLGWVERVRLRVANGAISATPFPFPSPAAKASFAIDSGDSALVHKTIDERTIRSGDTERTIRDVYYELRFGRGRTRPRLARFLDVEQAMYAAQCVNEALGVTTRVASAGNEADAGATKRPVQVKRAPAKKKVRAAKTRIAEPAPVEPMEADDTDGVVDSSPPAKRAEKHD